MNKILNSSLRAEIDRLLLEGMSVYQLENWCKEHCLVVSATSLKRYAELHLPEWNNKILPVMAVHGSKPAWETGLSLRCTTQHLISLHILRSSRHFRPVVRPSMKQSTNAKTSLITCHI